MYLNPLFKYKFYIDLLNICNQKKPDNFISHHL